MLYASSGDAKERSMVSDCSVFDGEKCLIKVHTAPCNWGIDEPRCVVRAGESRASVSGSGKPDLPVAVGAHGASGAID